ncbi:unnamed protein product [Calypogeia fissa]
MGPFRITREQYLADRSGKIRGAANPSIMDKLFWKYMIARNGGCNVGRKHFPKTEDPLWCFDRLGRTATVLPDGRHVLIGGKHVNFRNHIDFCIYNDVVVIANQLPPSGPESITIYGYPVDVFPPTHSHSSTYIRDQASGKDFIYIIGGWGYGSSAFLDRTDVYRLDLSDFSIEHLPTSGDKPSARRNRRTSTTGYRASVVNNDDGHDVSIHIITKDGKRFSLLINKLTWISHN